jgi:hypothetical protein
MPALRNTRWELFAQKLSTGMTQIDAHEAAGYPRSSSNSSTLAKNPAIRDRVQELIEERQHAARDEITQANLPHINPVGGKLTPEDIGITEEWLVRQLMLNISSAQQDGKYKEANTAIEMLGNYFGGLFSPKNVDKPKDEGNKGEEAERKKGLDDLMQRMAEGLNKPDEPEDK